MNISKTFTRADGGKSLKFSGAKSGKRDDASLRQTSNVRNETTDQAIGAVTRALPAARQSRRTRLQGAAGAGRDVRR